MIGIILGAVLAVGVVALIALPFLRDPEGVTEVGLVAPTEEVIMLLETRDRTLAALKELEFDHRTGRIDDLDYRNLVGPLRRTAAETLQSLDRVRATAESDGSAAPAPAGSEEERLPE